jgi:hypothetical protein
MQPGMVKTLPVALITCIANLRYDFLVGLNLILIPPNRANFIYQTILSSCAQAGSAAVTPKLDQD